MRILHLAAASFLLWVQAPPAAAAPAAGTPAPAKPAPAAPAAAGTPAPAKPAAPAAAPASTNPHVSAGLSLFEQGLLQAADEQLRQALVFEPNTPLDAVQLQILDGMLRAVSADDDLARAAFGRALALNAAVTLPSAATTRVRRVFEQARRELEARTSNRPALASQISKLSTEGKLEGAEALLADAGARKGLTPVESGQLFVLKGLVTVLKGLQAAGPAEGDKAKAAQGSEKQLQAVERQLASEATASLSEAESAQRLMLKGMVLLVKGLVKAESGDEAQAKAAFAQALELDPAAQIPAGATAKVQKLFETAKADAAAAAPPASSSPAAKGLPGEVARLYADGKLERAELLLARSAERSDLTKAESGQLYVLKGLLLVLKGLQKAGPKEQDRARAALGAEGQMKALEVQLAATARASLTDAESAQHLMLKGLVLMVKGLVKAESGNDAQAREAFAQALELDPNARLPATGAAKVQKVFETAKADAAATPPEPRVLIENLPRLFAEGKLERAELVLAESSARADLTRAESEQLFVLKGVLQVLKSLQGTGPTDGERARAALGAGTQIKAIEARLASGADAPLSRAESAQRHLLEGLALVIKGLLQAESGDEVQARASFGRGLALAPGVKLPAVASPRSRQLFEAARISGGSWTDLTPPGSGPPAHLALRLPDEKTGPLRWTGWGLTAGSAALVAGGAVAGIISFSAYQGERDAAARGDWEAYGASYNTVRTAGRVADGLYIGGAVALGAGAALLWMTRGEGWAPGSR